MFDLGGLVGAIIGTMILLGIYRAVAGGDDTPRRTHHHAIEQRAFAAGSPSNVWLAVSAPAFDLQSHSLHSDGELPAAQVVENAATAGVELLALSDHDTVDGVDEALAAGAVHGVRVVPGHRDLGRRRPVRGPARARLRDRPPQRAAGRAPARRARRPRAPRRRDGGAAPRARLRGRPGADRGAQGGRQAGRAAAPGRGGARAPRERGAARRGGPCRRVVVHPRLPDPGEAGLRGSHASRPSRRRSAWIHDAAGVAVWAHPFWDIDDSGEVLAAIDRYRAAGLDGVEVFYTVAHARADAAARASAATSSGLLSTGSSDYHGPDHRLFSRFRAFDLHGREPNLGPIAHGTLAAPARGGLGPLLLAHGPVRLRQVHGRPARRRPAARPRPPRGGARRRRRAPEPLRGPRLLARGPRRERAPHRVGGRPARHATAWSRSWRRCRPTGAPRDEARARMGERFVEVHVRASVDECERRDVKGLYERARAGRDPGLHRRVRPVRGAARRRARRSRPSPRSPEESAARLVEYVEQRLSGSRSAAAPSA